AATPGGKLAGGPGWIGRPIRARAEVVRALQIEAERGAVLVLLVNDVKVVCVELRRDGFGELRGAEDGREDLQREMHGEKEAEGPGGERERGGMGIRSWVPRPSFARAGSVCPRALC